MRRIILTLALAAAMPLGAQQTVDKSAEPTRAATTALTTLRALAEQAPEVVGLSAQEAATAQLRPPLRVVFVALDKLKTFHSGDDPRALLVDVGTVFYPVAVGSEVRSSITVKKSDDGWAATEFGNQALAKRIDQARGGATEAALLVRVPALNLDFVGTESGGTLQLTSLFDVPGTDIRTGSTADARTVLAALDPLANAHNGLPS
jgi:hypothetical protein